MKALLRRLVKYVLLILVLISTAIVLFRFYMISPLPDDLRYARPSPAAGDRANLRSLGRALKRVDATVSRDQRLRLAERINLTMNSLPQFREQVHCDSILDGDPNAARSARKWRFDSATFWYQHIHRDPMKKCESVRETFAFSDQALSDEEAQFPLAYGMLVYKNAVQVYLMLSAVYHPQNAYCIAVDGNTTSEFKRRMGLLGECFPNVYVMGVGDVSWGGYEVVQGVLSCVKLLSDLRHPWKYYQYLSGFDLPLKTNLEMVRIFKQLNGTANVEVSLAERKHLPRNSTSPLPVWKASMSAVLPRAAVDFIVHSEKAQQFERFLKNVMLPDEKLWATLTGNPSELPVPGGFDARALYKKIIKDRPPPNPAFGADGAWNRMWAIQNSPVQDEPLYDAMESDRQKRAKGPNRQKPTAEEPFALQDHWIGRYQIWWMNDVDKCRGMWRKDSCVFGVGDLPDLLASSQLVAHKLYLNFEPAAFFCLYEKIRLRALDSRQQRFVGAAYARLPQVQLARGVNISDAQTYFGQMLG